MTDDTEIECAEPGCDVTFSGEWASVASVNHYSAVHIHGQQQTPRALPEVRVSVPGYPGGIALAVRFPGRQHWELVRRNNRTRYVAPDSELHKQIELEWPTLLDQVQADLREQASQVTQEAIEHLRKDLAAPSAFSRRCCIGPFADGRHAVNCLQRCQDCGGDPSGPARCKCGVGEEPERDRHRFTRAAGHDPDDQVSYLGRGG